MAGLASGTFAMNKILSKKRDKTLIFWAQGGLAVFSLLLTPCINLSVYSDCILMIFIVLAGFFTGFIFPLAGDLYRGSEKSHGKAAGIINSADHLGALLGSILTGIILIPVFGILKTSLLITLLNGSVLILWLISISRKEIL
jgi:predicted membrane-bound spermidine synthase